MRGAECHLYQKISANCERLDLVADFLQQHQRMRYVFSVNDSERRAYDNYVLWAYFWAEVLADDASIGFLRLYYGLRYRMADTGYFGVYVIKLWEKGFWYFVVKTRIL